MRSFYLLPLLLLTVRAANLFRRDDGNCVQCPDQPTPCSECPTEQVCVLVTRTCASCAYNQCQSLDTLTSPQLSKTPVSNNSSASYVILTVCGAGVALLLATGMFVVYRRRRQAAAALASGNDSDSHTQSMSSLENPLRFAVGKPNTALTTMQQQRGVSAVSSVEWDIGSSVQDDSVAFHSDLMHKPYGNVNRANDALARYTLNGSGPTPLLPEPVQNSDRFLSEFLTEVGTTSDDDDDEPLATAGHHRSLSTSSLNDFKFPSMPMKRTSNGSLPDIPEASYRDSYASQGSVASEASLHSIAKVNIARVEPAIARSTMVMPQRGIAGGSFTSMRSSNEFDSLGDSRNKLSAVGSGSFSRVASTISAKGHRQTMSLNTKWQAPLGRADAYQKLVGKTPDVLMNREKTEREKRRDSMVREAMRRASVEHVKLGSR